MNLMTYIDKDFKDNEHWEGIDTLLEGTSVSQSNFSSLLNIPTGGNIDHFRRPIQKHCCALFVLFVPFCWLELYFSDVALCKHCQEVGHVPENCLKKMCDGPESVFSGLFVFIAITGKAVAWKNKMVISAEKVESSPWLHVEG